MKEKEGISNPEELIADVLMRLEKLKTGQTRLEDGQARLETGQITLQEAMLDLVQVVKKNSKDIEYLKENMATRAGVNNLFEAMINRFDKSDRRMDLMQADIDELKKR